MSSCAVIGYGSWATTLVRQMTRNKVNVNWLISNPDVAEGILRDGCNPKYVRDVELDMSCIKIFDDINDTVRDCEFILLACPSAFLKQTISGLNENLEGKYIISAIKGIVPDECVTPLEYIHEHFDVPFHNLGLISGPTHAEEVSNGAVSYICACGSSDGYAEAIKELFSSPYLKIDTSNDIYGIEYAAILKNIYAIVSGIATGLGYGDNFKAVLVAQAARETKLFLDKSYPFERDTLSKPYLGDLLVTCYSVYSRNRRLGQLIGKGCTVKSALNEMTMVAEGYYSAKLIREIITQKNISMPIVELAYSILYQNANPRKSIAMLSKSL